MWSNIVLDGSLCRGIMFEAEDVAEENKSFMYLKAINGFVSTVKYPSVHATLKFIMTD